MQFAQALGYASKSGVENIISRNEYLKDPELSSTHKLWVGGTEQETRLFTEDGIYEVTMLSKTPKAREFRAWVREVIKSIRKHGGYLTPAKIEEVLLNPDTIIQLATKLKQEQEEKAALLKQIEADKPKVIFANSVSASKSSILVGELAKILKQNGINIGQNRFFKWLRDNGYLIKRKGTDYNMPTQKAMELGLFEIKETVVTHSDGHISISKTPKVTGKGQIYFINKFKGSDGSGGLAV